VGRNTVHDTHPREWLTLREIVKYSSNIGAIKLLEAMGPETLYARLRAFGFGSRTGVDLPGETSGRITPPDRWTRIDAATIAFGQGLSVSALQLAAAVAAVANDGVLMKPHLVQAVLDANGRPIRKTEPQVVRRAVSADTARILKEILQAVTTAGGTGTRAALEGYSVCGKTGTAQKIGPDGRYSRERYVSSFVGFAPADKPAIAIVFSVDEPTKRHYGGTVAAPGFRQIALKTLDYLNVAPRRAGGAVAIRPARKGGEV
jgi:cell division protein FtsI (penicillin-binding protein 3)